MPNFQAAIETETLIDRLSATNVGDLLAYAELSALIHADVQDAGAGYLRSARKHLLRQRVAFVTIRGVGIKRANDTEIVGDGHSRTARVRRAARRNVVILDCAEPDRLSPQDRYRRAALTAQNVIAAKATGSQANVRLRALAESKQAAALPTGEAASQFLGHIRAKAQKAQA